MKAAKLAVLSVSVPAGTCHESTHPCCPLLSPSATCHHVLPALCMALQKRKLRVISTVKRPVPLEHFLYTGQGGKSRDDRFLVLDSRGQFSRPGSVGDSSPGQGQ